MRFYPGVGPYPSAPGVERRLREDRAAGLRLLGLDRPGALFDLLMETPTRHRLGRPVTPLELALLTDD